MKNSIIPLVIISILVSSCIPNNSCDTCMESVNHMSEKLEDYSCKPANVDNAMKSVLSSCTDGGEYVGIMAESCQQGELLIPQCQGSEGVPDFKNRLANIEIGVMNRTSKKVEITIESIIGHFEEKRFVLEANSSELLKFKEELFEGLTFKVTSIDYETEQEIAVTEQDFSFDRPYMWDMTRLISLSKYANGPLIDFTYW